MQSVLAALLVAITAGALPSQRNGGAPPLWMLQPDLRLGGAADGPASFSEIRGIAVTRAGNIFVLEFKEQELRVFDINGKFLRRAARRGAGPGELENANGIAVGQDDIVWANDPGNSRFSLYRADGTFLQQVPVSITSYGYIWQGMIVGPGRAVDFPVLVPTSRINPQTKWHEQDSRVRFVTIAGTADTVNAPSCPDPARAALATLIFGDPGAATGRMYMSLPFQASQLIAFTRQGTVWCTPASEYRLLAGSIGGTLHEVVRREVAPVPVSDSERHATLHRIDSLRAKFGGLQSGDPSAIPRTKPVIGGLLADDQGRAWVRRNGMPDATPVFEVFDGSGRQVATVESHGPVGEQTIIVGNVLLTVLTDQDDVPYVARYQIRRP